MAALPAGCRAWAEACLGLAWPRPARRFTAAGPWRGRCSSPRLMAVPGTAGPQPSLGRSLARAAFLGLAARLATACRATAAGDAAAEDDVTESAPTEFNLALAVLLAGFAFEAYNTPQGAERFREHDAGGAEIAYLDGDLVRERYQGVLEVVVVGASGLPARDPWGTSDPYCLLRVGAAAARTQVQWRTLTPHWGETHQIFVADPSNSQLVARVMDKDLITADDALGEAILPLSSLADAGAARAVDLRLTGEGGGGTLQLRLRYRPLVHEPPAVLPPAEGQRADWEVLARGVGRDAGLPAAFAPCAFVDHMQVDSQAWVWRDVAARQLVVAFRGTEQAKWKDLMTDVLLTPAGFNPERAPSSGLLPDMREPLVHHGFRAAYDAVRGPLLALVDAICGTTEGNAGEWTLLVTGHSLGGALATLFAAELAQRTARRRPRLIMYNFGSPRVGNAAFAREYNDAVRDSWRVVNNGDVVPTVPRLLGYSHVDHAVRVDMQGVLASGTTAGSGLRAGQRDVLGEALPTDVLPGLVGDQLALTKLIAAERATLEALVDGSAISEHLEPNYYAALRQCVLAAARQLDREAHGR